MPTQDKVFAIVTMFTNLEESPITQLLQVLWRGRGTLGNANLSDDIFIGMSVPHTVVYEHNFPKGLFHAAHDGSLQRRVGKEIDSKTVFSVFSDNYKPTDGKRKTTESHNNVPGIGNRDPSGESDILAVYTERSAEGDVYNAQYFTDAGLRAFLLGSSEPVASSGEGGAASPDFIDLHPVPSKNGILQKFIYPIGIHNEIIQVVWTPHLCIAEKLKSCMLLGDTTKTPFQRAATIEAPPNFCTRAYVSPQVVSKIRAQCENLVDQLYVVERRFVEQMTLYFKIDENEHLWFLWSPCIRYIRGTSSDGDQAHHHHHHKSDNANPSSSSTSFKYPTEMIPKFVLPKSCGGDFAARSALYLSKNDTSHRLNKGIKGANDEDVKRMYHITNNMSFQSFTEDGVLSLKLPFVAQKCLGTPTYEATFVPPTQSKLCPKMTWRRGKPLSSEFFRSSQFDESSSRPISQASINRLASRSGSPKFQHSMSQQRSDAKQPSSLALNPTVMKEEPSLLSVASPMISRASSPQLVQVRHPSDRTPEPSSESVSHRGSASRQGKAHYSMREVWDIQRKQLSKLNEKDTIQSVIDILRSSQRRGSDTEKGQTFRSGKDAISEMQRSCERSPTRGRALDTLRCNQCEGDLHIEMELLRNLCKEPIGGKLAADPSALDAMLGVKSSMELAAQFLSTLRDAASTHFLLFPTIPSTGVSCPPFAFSVPSQLIENAEVLKALVHLCEVCFEKIDMALAAQCDIVAGRRGWCDDCSFHHEILHQKRLMEAQRVMHEKENRIESVAIAKEADDTDNNDMAEEGAVPPSDVAVEATAEVAIATKSEEKHDDVIKDLPCFRIRDIGELTRLLSKTSPFIVESLRNIHAELEQRLLTTLR